MVSGHWKKDKLCPVCGNTFKGTAKAQVCGSTCRGRLRRLLAASRKPEFYVMAQSKGQKVPLLVKPPTPQKPKEETIPESPVVTAEVIESTSPLTKEQALQKISELEAAKKKIAGRNVLIGNPKANALQKAMEIDELNDLIKELEKKLI